MSTPQPQITTLIIPKGKKQVFNVKAIISKYLYHWPLFLIALTIAISTAIIYLGFAKPVYEITATLIIKDNTKVPGQQSALSQIDLLSSSKLIENEIEVLKSHRLVSQVVKELNLAIGYREKDGLNVTELYKSSPVQLIILKPAVTNRRGTAEFNDNKITIIIKDKNTFFLKNGDDASKEYAFNTPLTNSLGTWKLEATNLLPQYKGATIRITVSDPEQLALKYQNSIDALLTNKLATAITLTLEDQVAQRGKDILNQLILDYSRAGTQEDEQKAKATLEFLDKRLDSLASDLRFAETGIEDYKSSNGLTDISAESKISLENMQDNDKQLNEVNIKLSVINGIESYVNSPNSGQAPATIGIDDPALNSLVENLSKLQLQRDRLLAISPETNPDFDPINRQISTTRTAIKENVKNIKTSLINMRSKLQSYNAGFESSIKKIPTQERQLVSSKRQQSVKEALYTYLLQKREEIATNYANIISLDRVVDKAYAGTAKTPQKLLFISLAIFFGICTPISLIYGRDAFSSEIVDCQEIKDRLDLPVIAEIPQSQDGQLVSAKSFGTSAINEQLRSLRISLIHPSGGASGGLVTLVTSSVSGEGKSYISCNLALTFAHTEKKAIILELDLRKPQIFETFQLKSKLGMTDYLTNNANLADIIQVSELNPSLDVICSGTTINNPAELLEVERLSELFSTLKKIYAHIIIDTPPVHLVPDALLLSRFCDTSLYIIRQGITQKSELSFIQDLQKRKLLTNIQIVFNGIEPNKYGYGYTYNSSYYNEQQSSIFKDFWKRF